MIESKQHIIELSNIQLGYPPERILLERINAHGSGGELIALMGRNGSGKSTLLRTIAGLSDPIQGEIHISGKPLRSYNRQNLARMLTYVGTAIHIPENLTVFEMISLGRHPFTNWWGSLKSEDVNVVNEALEFVDMLPFSHKKMHTLSDGERQRVLTAMALSQDVNLILLDEPTAFLDIPNRMNIIKVLHEIRKDGKTVVYSTHDFDSAMQFADKIWLLHENQLVQGAPEDLGVSGYYDQVFNDTGISFDNETMQFRNTHSALREILFEVDERVQESLWTRKMLQRIGYRVVSGKIDKEAIPSLVIDNDNNNLIWELSLSLNTSRFESLYKLAAYLQRN